MKYLISLFMLAGLLLIMQSCGGAEGEGAAAETTNAPKPSWAMTALVDSMDWKATDVTTKQEEGTLYVIGTAEDGSQVILEMSQRPSIGIFTIRRGTPTAATYINKDGSKYFAPFGGTTGVVNITGYAKDSMLAGEFNFGATNSLDLHIISEGKFIAPVIQNAANSPAM